MRRFGRGLFAALLAPAAALAEERLVSTAIDVQHFKPGPGATDVLNVLGADVAENLAWRIGAYVNYADNPLSVVDPVTGRTLIHLIDNQATLDLVASIGLLEHYELGLSIPATLQGSQPASAVDARFLNGVAIGGFGDVRLVPKVRLQRWDFGLTLGLALPLLVPSGNAQAFLSSGFFSLQPQVIGDFLTPSGIRLVGNLGVKLRKPERILNLIVGQELSYGIAGTYPFQVQGQQLAVTATLNGDISLHELNTEELPLELMLALQYRLFGTVGITFGGGKGLTRGYGTPDWRLFAGVTWDPVPPRAPPPPEETMERVVPDGVTAVVERACTLGPEDLDGFQDDDACGDPDNDADGVLDEPDRCPNVPENANGWRDEDGCPDGQPDPAEASFLAAQREPAGDADGDGIDDDRDACAMLKEDMDAFEDLDGCPDDDNDRDGVADAGDQCLLEAEVINGNKDDDGCPDAGKVSVEVRGAKIVILSSVYFASGKAVILDKSFSLLAQVARTIKAHPEIVLLRVEGHTDSEGPDQKNLELSQRRAESVRAFLIKEDIDGNILQAVGYGETQPIADNQTKAGRDRNRRVEFIVLKVREGVAP
jgi:outer membrane protein OmpA-like peptidoglycan-associated protein